MTDGGGGGGERGKDVSPSFLNATEFASLVVSLPVSCDSRVGRMFFIHFDVDLCR